MFILFAVTSVRMKNYLALKDLILNNLVFAKNIYNIETVPNKKIKN